MEIIHQATALPQPVLQYIWGCGEINIEDQPITKYYKLCPTDYNTVLKTSEHLANGQADSVHDSDLQRWRWVSPTPPGKKVLVYSTMKP